MDFLRKSSTLYKNNLNIPDSVACIITNYHSVEAIKTGKFKKDTLYDEILNAEEFANLISGKNTKNLLFEEQSFDKRRLYIEEYYKV